MARAGLYKSDVKRARDTLIAAGRHPSLDAVRIGLGNTGSKTTIHKYLKELEAEEGAAAKGFSLSEELQALVARMAERLHEEADSRILVVRSECDAQMQRQAEIGQALQQELSASQARELDLERQLAAARSHAVSVLDQLQHETIARHTAEQRVTDLTERLAENEGHRQSLEDKHAHARDALEHYRLAAKEQRDQEQRRHEHQLQQLQADIRQLQQTQAGKQEELTRLNQEGARLVSDLLHTRQTLSETRHANECRESELTGQLATLRKEADASTHQLQQQLSEARLDAAGHAREIKLLQKDLSRLQHRHDQLLEEKVTWRHERAQLEDMIAPKDGK
ncbi:DNA-binding protein [Massilia sp. SR12]